MSADDLPAEVLNNGPRQPGVGMAVRKRRWPWIALTAVVLTVAAVGISGFLVYQDAMRVRDSGTQCRTFTRNRWILVKRTVCRSGRSSTRSSA